MWLPNNIVTDVDHVARIYYINKVMCINWNANRQEGELRLLTGWCWVERGGRNYRQGFKTQTVAYRDAYYALIAKTNAPGITVGVKLRKVG